MNLCSGPTSSLVWAGQEALSVYTGLQNAITLLLYSVSNKIIYLLKTAENCLAFDNIRQKWIVGVLGKVLRRIKERY
jgi:hypothetical protein